MHPTAEAGFRRMLDGAHFDVGERALRVLDIGGADVNGTVHEIVRLRRAIEPVIDVLDVAPGPGVTIVADATDPGTWSALTGSAPYDLVISTETLEHVRDWRSLIWGALFALRPGGWFVGTCATHGRRPHGARGEYDPPEGEHYANVGSTPLSAFLASTFTGEVCVEYSRQPNFPTTHDLYWRAQA